MMLRSFPIFLFEGFQLRTLEFLKSSWNHRDVHKNNGTERGSSGSISAKRTLFGDLPGATALGSVFVAPNA